MWALRTRTTRHNRRVLIEMHARMLAQYTPYDALHKPICVRGACAVRDARVQHIARMEDGRV